MQWLQKSSQRLELFKALADYALFSINYCYENKGKTALHFCLEAGDLEAVKFLLSHGAKANLKDMDGKTPLHFALKHGKDKAYEMVKLLLFYNADVNTETDAGETPLLTAIFHQQSEAALLLLEHSAFLMLGIEKLSPLEICMDHPEMLAVLKKSAQFDIDMPNFEGFTVLGKAILENDLEAMDFWIGQGADVQKCSVQTPLLLAYFKHNKLTIVDQSFTVKDADSVILEKLIQWNFDVNVSK